jgi:glycosyltransferase involved in cell wall biosynthesis
MMDKPHSDGNAGPALKVCHLVSGDLWAGVEVMDYRLLKGLRTFQDLSLSAIVLNDGRFADEVRKLGIHVDVVDETRLRFPQVLGRVRQILRELKPDVVHSHWYKENVLAYLATRRGRTISLVSTQHGLPEYLGRRADIKYLALHQLNFFLLSRYFHGTVAVSNEVRKTLTEHHGFDGNRTFVIRNGTEPCDGTHPERSRGRFTIGSSGRFFPVKDFPLMVETAREIASHADGISFELAGEGPEVERIGDRIRRYGLERTFLLRGFLNEVSTFYHGLDLYLNTSRHEGIPMSVLEAMAHGLPIVAPDLGGLREIIDDGVQGYLVKEREPRCFAERCMLLYRDEGLRQRMGLAAKERIEAVFSSGRMARDYYRLYRSLPKPGRIDADGVGYPR